jgi:TIR domain
MKKPKPRREVREVAEMASPKEQKVFISWSGDYSRQLAAAIKEWLPMVLQSVEAYFSDTDIEVGSTWYNEIIDALERSDAGLIILTPENITRQWIMFEAGAMARGVSKDRVCPILFGLKKRDLKGPLQFRQSVEFTEGDFRKLLKTINNGRIGETAFNKIFDTWWPKLKQSIEAINPASQPVLQEPSPDELMQEILGVMRNLVIEQQKLVQALTPPPDVANYVHALLRPSTATGLDFLTGRRAQA